MKVYEPEDFEGLFTYLVEDECDGPRLMTCKIGDKETTEIDKYLLNIDDCLYSNDCLSYHQILSLKQKLNMNSSLLKRDITDLAEYEGDDTPLLLNPDNDTPHYI